MPKYTEKNVLKLKQDADREAKRLEEAVTLREAEERELARLKLLTKEEEGKVSRIWETANQNLHIIKTAEKDLTDDCEALRADKAVLVSQVTLWRHVLGETVERMKSVATKKKDTFIDSLIYQSERVLGKLVSQRRAEELRVEGLTKEREHLERTVPVLQEQERAFAGKGAVLEQKIAKKQKELAALEDQKKEIMKREHNVKVMEARLTPEYQRIYRGRKGNKES